MNSKNPKTIMNYSTKTSEMGKNPNEINMNNQNRNELCNCGSGKKFKKCCESVFEFTTDLSFYKIVKGDIDNRVLDLSNLIKWRTSIVKLPDEIKSTIKDFLKKNEVANYGCYYNSFSLSLFDNRIKTIKGWYGKKMNDEEIVSAKKYLQNLNFNGRFLKYNDNLGRTYTDTKNWIIYSPHSWNEINGITFDLTTESNPIFDTWIYYVKNETIDINPIISNNKIFDFYTCKIDEITTRIKNKFGVNNSNLLNLINSEVSTFSMVA
jgi:hypothetical protein